MLLSCFVCNCRLLPDYSSPLSPVLMTRSSHSESDGRELFKVRSGSSPPRRDKNSHHGGSTTDSSSSVSSSSANTQERSGESNGSVGGVGEGGNLTNAGESVKSGANGGAGNGNGGNGNSGANAAAFLSPRTGTNSNETGSSFFSYLNDPLQSGPHADLSGQSSTESKKGIADCDCDCAFSNYIELKFFNYFILCFFVNSNFVIGLFGFFSYLPLFAYSQTAPLARTTKARKASRATCSRNLASQPRRSCRLV